MNAGAEIQVAAQQVEAIKMQAAATLAAALIAASGRPHSVAEATQLMRDFQWTLWPSPNHGTYEAWKKKFDPDKKHT